MWLRVNRRVHSVMVGRKVPQRLVRVFSADRFRRRLVHAGWACLALLLTGIGLAQAATYVYDANGRLRAVTNSTSASAEYVYDAMGNLLQVESVPANQLAIFAFTPDHGAIGTAVTISGQGFSATAADDTVKFNGTVATVSNATTTTLTTSVPTGATTGTITVTVGSATATSSDVFTIDTTGLPPKITSFSPTIGVIGTAVTAVGTNLDPVNNQTTVGINGWKTGPTSATETQVVFPVTAAMGSGQVFATTPFGTGVSSGYFYVLPPSVCGNNAANVKITKVIAAGQSTGAMAIPAGDCAAVLFNATAGSYLSFQASGIAGSTDYTIYDGHNHPIGSGTLSTSSASIHLPVTTISGTYSIWLSPGYTAASLTLGLQADKMLPLNSALTTSTTSLGQSQRLFFNGSLGQTFGLQLVSQSTTPSGGQVQYTVDAPNGTQVNSVSLAEPTFINLNGYSATGAYNVVVTPNPAATVSSRLELVSGVAAKLQVDGASVSLSTKWLGQNAYISFAAQAGANLGWALSNLTATYGSVSVNIYDPSNSLIEHFPWCYASNGGCAGQVNNAVAGTYQIIVSSPAAAELYAFQATVSKTFLGTISLNTPVTVSLPRPGQQGDYTFTTTQAGATLALQIGNQTTVPNGQFVGYEVVEPNGTYFDNSVPPGVTFNMPNVPAGTTHVYVGTTFGATVSGSMELFPGVTGVLTVGSSSQPFATSVPGENIYIDFSTATTQNLTLSVSNVSVSDQSDGGDITVVVYNSSNEEVQGVQCFTSCQMNLSGLTADDYSIIITPPISDSTMSFNAALGSQ